MVVEHVRLLLAYLRSTTVTEEDTQPTAGIPPEASDASAPTDASSKAPVERWLRDHGDVLWRFVVGRVPSREIAEDIVQETFLAAIQARAAFAGSSSERTWLIGIASHKIADHFRAQRRRTGDADAALTDNSGPETADMAGMYTAKGKWAKQPGAWGLDAGNTPENAEILAALHRCIQALPPSQAQAVWLRDLLDIPGLQVCKAMDISPTNLWSRMHRARAALRQCVENSMGINKEGSK